MVPIEENPNVENPVFTPADQAATGAVGEISIPEVHELGPGNDQGVAHVLEPATLPDANADRPLALPQARMKLLYAKQSTCFTSFLYYKFWISTESTP